MPRRKQFTVDAEDVQGCAGATVTFSAITVGERREYLDDADINDIVMLKRHIVSWSGIVDDDDHELPSPSDDPDVMNALYMQELRALSTLLWRGPGESAKN